METYSNTIDTNAAGKCHNCGRTLTRGTQPMTISYHGLSATFDMPGAYCECGEGIVTAQDMDVSDRHLSLLKIKEQHTNNHL
jgi:HTH-type transcriptional regulator/antitoxin MqsA